MSSSFADLGVPPAMVASLRARDIDEPFPIQVATIPDALEGRDICGRAPTGSGKTIAFGVPMVVDLTSGSSRPKRPRGLVLVPTRELAAQVCHELQLLAKPKGPWVESFYGGVRFDRQVSALQRGVDIAVACPGRLADLINQGVCKLDDVAFVVIDEADRMADMGFLPEVRRLLDQCSSDRQTLLFSATLDGDVDVLIKQYQRDPARHEHLADEESGMQADHYFWKVDRMDRLKTAASVVKRLGPTVVFCRTKRGADRIAKQLDGLGVRAVAIHGDRSQKQREEALRAFHQGKVQALVATDVAARGIHVDGVEGVVHYDPPADPKDYVHRSGRTARAGARGVVVSLVAPELRKAVAVIQAELGYDVGLAPVDLEVLGAEGARPAPKPRVEKPRAEKPRPERVRTEKPRAEKPRPERVRTEKPRAEKPRTEKPRTEKPRTERFTPAPTAARPPLAEGQRRPSGAARRKAKRLAAAEALARGEVVSADGWTAADLYDGTSSRPRRAAKPVAGTKKRKPTAKPGVKAGAKAGAKAGTKVRSGKASGGRPPAAKRSGRSSGR